MARRIDAEVAVNVTGQDKVDKLEKQLDDLSGGKTEVPVEVDTGTAARDITDLLAKVDKLAADPAQLLLASNAGQIANDIAGLLVDIDRLDSSDPTIDAKITNVNQLTGDLDQIQAKVKEIDDTKVTVDTTPTVGGINRVSDSARGARSALGNMIGNATQDLGALGGVAGSSGVAIGQMGEYMADAALSGEALSSVIGNFAKVAGPVAALAIAFQAITSAQKSAAEQAQRTADSVKRWTDALDEGGDAASNMTGIMEEQGKVVLDNARNYDLATQLLTKIPVINLFDKPTEDITGLFKQVALAMDDYNRAVVERGQAEEDVRKSIEESNLSDKDKEKLLTKLADDIVDYNKAAENRTRNEKIFASTAKSANDILQQIIDKQDPLKQMTDQWGVLFADMRDGKIDTQAAADAVDTLAVKLGISKDEVVGIAQAELDKQMQDAAAAAQDYQNAVADIATQVENIQTGLADWQTAVDEATVSVAGMMDSFDASKVETVTTALGDFLAVRQPGVGWLDTLGETKTALGDIFSQIKDNEGAIPDIFATGTEKGRDFRDVIDQASQSVNEQLLGALQNAQGDFQKVRDQADALRQAMIKKIEMRTGLSMDVPAERTRILGLVNAVVPTKRQINVGIELAKEDLDKLKAQLAIESLQSLLPKTALQLQVDLAEGKITPEEAAATAEVAINKAGVKVDLGVNTKKADEKLVTFADEERSTKMGVTIPDKQLVGAAGTILAGPGGQGWPPIRVPVIPVLPPGTTGGGGGGLGAFPSAAPTATATTSLVPYTSSAPRTARTTPVVVNQSVTFNAATVGDPWDVMRQIERMNRRIARFLPVNP